jgi:hypothetical protein
MLLDKSGGDLRRLRDPAGRDPARERAAHGVQGHR